MSLNVNGVNDGTKLHEILCSFALQSTITFFQETKFSNPHISEKARHKWDQLVQQQGAWFECPPRYATTDNEHSCRGVVTMVHPHAPITDLVQVTEHASELDNRYVLARGRYQGKVLYLHNIYAPADPDKRAAFFAALPKRFEPDAEHIAGGDFNVILSEALDSFEPLPDNLQGVDQLLLWLSELRLVDVYRQDNPSTISYTSPRHNNRLDYIFVSETLYVSAPTKSTHIHANTRSDHSACRFELATQAQQRTGPWRTPHWLTQLPEAAEIIDQCLDKFLEKVSIGPTVARLYDYMVTDMRTKLRQLHCDRVAADTAPRRALKRELTVALTDLNRHPCQAIIDAILDIKRRLEEHNAQVQEHKTEAAVQRHLAEAARCTKYHLRSPSIKKLGPDSIHQMRDANGQACTSPHQISQALHEFYTSLYAAEEGPDTGEVDHFLDSTIKTRLPSDMAARLGAPILASELYECIQKAARRKAPGPNALPYEILQLAPAKWASALELVFNHALFDQETLTPNQLALVDQFCSLSGFKLNRDKTQVLTHTPLPNLTTLQLVQPSQPTKALGILVAPNLPRSARCDYALRRLRDRLLLWRHKATTLAGKAIILQAVCLPVLWYQLAWVTPDSTTAANIDKMILQFINGEPPVIGEGAQGHRLLHQSIVFAPKHQAGLGLKPALFTWSARHRGHSLRFLQAALTSYPDPAWSSPSMAVIAHAYAPWGNFADLAFADPTLPRIRRLLTSSAVPGRFKFMLNYWFDMRVGPSTLPAPSPLVYAQPLWSNEYLPVNRDSYVEKTTRWHTRYTRTMATIGITQAQHVHNLMLAATPTETLATRAQRLIQAVKAKCHSRNLGTHVTPNDKWLGWLAIIVDAFKCGPLPSPTPKPPWLVRLHNATKLLTQMTPAEARRSRAPPRTRFQLPTRHLEVDDDFYKAPAAVAAAADLRLPDAILPKYADFVYQVMLRAVKFRAHLHWLDRANQACLFCLERETYSHFLVDCTFIQDVWNTLHAAMAPLGVTLPTTLSGYLYSTPKTASNMHQRAFRYLWPVLRACVWFNVWRVRNDRVFRADLPLPSPRTIAVKAARVAQLHLHHSLIQNPGQTALRHLLRVLAQHEWPRLHLVPQIALLPLPA
ncbi:hypothetical protein ACHHYP_07832 [Achlya hypogyna]|uniref:Endonuclease/exonuclease/phosphatase domain-containing protein n=1 Tax=Achlya hypogyna TaxID=1202772 RepID=A0A1V9YQ82_ACHHY|nr:hypothetical protein ACHHYP_07832 [Achlya hypogyna]